MRRKHQLVLVASLFCFVLLSSQPSRAQAIQCPPGRNQVSVRVEVAATFDPATGLYTYQYSVFSEATSVQDVMNFAVDFAPEISNRTKPRGWTTGIFADRPTFNWAATESAGLPPGVPDRGQIPPPLFPIKPGSTLGGFSFQSPNPPGPVNSYVRGFAEMPSAPSELEAEELMDACPEVFGDFFDQAVKGITQGPVIPVQMEITPPSQPHPASINPGTQGVVPVAILGSATFDVSQVNPASVRFGPKGAPARNGEGKIEDVNGDAIPDMLFHFEQQATGIACADTSATLMGKLKTTGEFPFRGSQGAPVSGSQPIVTVGCEA